MKDTKKVLLNCVEQDIKNKEFDFDQAAKLFVLQKKLKRNDWTLADGQKYQLKDGILTEYTDSIDNSKRNKTARTEELPEA
jgi:hypothetical protein